MSILTRMVDALRRPPDLAPILPFDARSVGGLYPSYQVGKPTWLPSNISTYRDDGYAKAPVVYRCVTALANAVSAAPLRIYDEEGGGQRTEVEVHPLRDLLRRPNPAMGEAPFWAFTTMLMATSGFAVLEIVRGRAGRPVELWHLRPEWLRAIPRDSAAPDWEYRISDGRVYTLKAEDVVVLTWTDSPTFGHTGLSPISVALRALGVENAAVDFLKLFLESGGVPKYALVTPNQITDQATADTYKERWMQAYGGYQNWVNIALLHGGMDVKQIGMNLDDMVYPELRDMTAIDICLAFGIPPVIVGVKVGLENSPWSNIGDARRIFHEDTVRPLWERIEDTIGRRLLPEFDSRTNRAVHFDSSDIPALQTDESPKWARAGVAVGQGWVMVDEARMEVGLPPLPNGAGQLLLLPFSATPTRPADLIAIAEQGAEPPAPVPAALAPFVSGEETGEETDEAEDAERATRMYRLPLERRTSALKVNRLNVARVARKTAPALRAFWRAQGERIAAEAVRSGIPLEARDLTQVDWDEELRLLTEVLTRYHALAGETAYAALAEQIGIGIDWNLANPNVQRVLDRLAERIVGINQTTIDDVRRVVGSALDEGVTVQDLGGRLKGLFEETYRNRSLTVARTESQVAYNLAQVLGYAESGAVPFAELADNPDHIEGYGASDGLSCADRNGLIVSLDRAPRHIEAEHPNGSLGVLPVLSRPLGDE